MIRKERITQRREPNRGEGARDLTAICESVRLDRIDIARDAVHNRPRDRVSYRVDRLIVTNSPQGHIARTLGSRLLGRRTPPQEFPRPLMVPRPRPSREAPPAVDGYGSATRSTHDRPSIRFPQE